MKRVIAIAMLATAAWAADFSQYSTEELINMRGTVPVADRADFRAELRNRMATMTPEQRQQFQNSKAQRGRMGMQAGTGQGMGANRAVNRPSFATFDLNKDGVITENELMEVRQKRQAARAATGAMMRNAGNAPAFSTMDANGDGKITQAEYAKFQSTRMQNRRPGMGRGQGRGQGRGMMAQ